jgi:LysM repeat protein
MPGDTLWKIAQKYGTTVAKLVAANNLDPNKYLMIGQRIKIVK